VTLNEEQTYFREKYGDFYVQTTIEGIAKPAWVLRIGANAPNGKRQIPSCRLLVELPSGVFGAEWIIGAQRDLETTDVPCGAAEELLRRTLVVLAAGGYSYLPGS
jgi:hypothetical protein